MLSTPFWERSMLPREIIRWRDSLYDLLPSWHRFVHLQGTTSKLAQQCLQLFILYVILLMIEKDYYILLMNYYPILVYIHGVTN
jgi:hypothetical protein